MEAVFHPHAVWYLIVSIPDLCTLTYLNYLNRFTDKFAVSLKNWNVALSRFLLFSVEIKLFRVFTNAFVMNVVDIGSM